MSYYRVIPRDLFNEAKLLKCLGFLVLKIHDGLIDLNFEHEDPEEGFKIVQDENSGALSCCNLTFYNKKGEEVIVFSPYNSRGNFPLVFLDSLEEENCVFDDEGNFSEWFLLNFKN